MSVRWLVVVLLVAGCKTQSSRTTDIKSSSMKSPQMKLAYLRDYLSGPTQPLEAEFHIVFHDNSGNFFPGSDDYDIKAVVKVKPDDVPQWAMGCTRYRLEAFPPWAEPLLRARKGWEVSSQPDTFKCGREERVIHVREGVIYRRVNTED